MTIDRTDIRGNVASGALSDQGGGGAFNDGGEMTIVESDVVANVADGAAGSGGGVLNNLGTLTVMSSRLLRNSAVRAGGAIEANVGSTYLAQVEVSENEAGAAPGNGGGLHLAGAGYVEIDESVFKLNNAVDEGGALWNSSTGTMIATSTMFSGNTAAIRPRAFNDGGTSTINGRPVPVGP